MSDQVARAALTRMNMRPVAICPTYSAAMLAADLKAVGQTSQADGMKAFLDSRVEMCAAYGFNTREQSKPFAFADGFAVIPVHGTLLNRFSWSYSGATGYNFIRSQLRAALADDDVKAIIFDVNSYGGECAGCFELADEIRESRATKPSLAVIDSNAYSAGFAIASAATKTVAIGSGGAGSVGVIAMHVDMSKMLADWGLTVTLLYEGEHKADGNPYEPLSEETKARFKESIHTSYESFVALAAQNTGLDPKVIRDTQSKTYSAKEALSLGLIDAIATPSEAVRAFSGELSGSTTQPDQEDDMSANANKPGTDAGTSAITVTAEQATLNERARVKGITTCEEAKGRSALANHLALNTDMSVDAAKGILAASPAETDKKAEASADAGDGFKQAMDAGKHPEMGAEGEGSGTKTDAQSMLAAYGAATGRDFSKK